MVVSVVAPRHLGPRAVQHSLESALIERHVLG
jgi:hypothetical protein